MTTTRDRSPLGDSLPPPGEMPPLEVAPEGSCALPLLQLPDATSSTEGPRMTMKPPRISTTTPGVMRRMPR